MGSYPLIRITSVKPSELYPELEQIWIGIELPVVVGRVWPRSKAEEFERRSSASDNYLVARSEVVRALWARGQFEYAKRYEKRSYSGEFVEFERSRCLEF